MSDSVTPWTVSRQAPLSMGSSRQEHWSGLPFPPPGDLPDLCIKCMSLAAPVLAGRFLTAGPAGKCLSFLRRRPVHSLLFTLTASLVRAFSPSTNQPTIQPPDPSQRSNQSTPMLTIYGGSTMSLITHCAPRDYQSGRDDTELQT